MRANREYINNPDNWMHCYRLELPYFEYIWHYHPECELSFIAQGSGQRTVGDSINRFEGSDLFFTGSNLPHALQSVPKDESVIVYGIQFHPDRLEEEAINKAEFINIKRVLSTSYRGLTMPSEKIGITGKKVIEIFESTGIDRYVNFLKLLDFMGAQTDLEFLTTPDFKTQLSHIKNERLFKVYQFIHDHFQSNLKLSDLADVANMSESSFSRYFKKQTGKTFTNYVNNLKVNHATVLLRESDLAISQIAHDAGFSSNTHFHRTFYNFKKQTPLRYRLKFKTVI